MGGVVLSLSFLAFLFEVWGFYRNARWVNSKKMSGAEIARHILDSKGYRHIPVESCFSQRDPKSGGDQPLYLKREVFDGRSLTAVALAAQAAVARTREGNVALSLPPAWRGYGLVLTQGAVVVGWVALLLGLLGWPDRALAWVGEMILMIFFGLAVFDVIWRWDLADEVMSLLKKSGHFEVDEIVYLKRILQALRFRTVAQIYAIPLNLLRGRI